MSAKRQQPAAEPDKPGSTRGRLLAAAERLFAEQGYRSVSMPAIAEASGITAGAIYKHFDSKEDLFFEAVAQRSLQAATLTGAGARDSVTGLIGAVAAYTSQRAKLLRQLAVEIHSASVHNAKVRRLLNRSLEHNIAQIRNLLAAAQRSGEVDPSVDSQLLARALMVFIMGLMHMETLLPQCIGDAGWQDFVAERMSALLGVRPDSRLLVHDGQVRS